jgi:hypothetical protein
MKAIVEDHDFVRGLGRDTTVVKLDKEELFVLLGIVAEAVVEGRGSKEICAAVFFTITIREASKTLKISVLDCGKLPSIAIPALGLMEVPEI